MNLCELENMHTQIKCYTVGQLTTELTTPSFNQLKTEAVHGYPENHCNTSYHSCIFMDNNNNSNNNGTLTSLNTDNTFSHEINSSNNTYCNINQKFSHHGKHLQKHSHVNDQEVTPNYDYVNSDIPWTRYYADNLTNSVESYDHNVHTNNDCSNLPTENYLTSSYHYDHHAGSSQMHSLTTYSIMNGMESSYFTNDDHQHCLNGTVQSNDLNFLDFHNNYHEDRKPDVMSFMNTSTIVSDNNCINDSTVNASISSLSNQYCVSQGIVLGNLKSFNSMDQFNSVRCDWLSGQGSIEDNTNWQSSWKSSIEYDNQTNGQLYNQKSVTDEFKTFQCLSTETNSPITHNLNLSSGAYFWLYNSQCKGPKASPLINLTNRAIASNHCENSLENSAKDCVSNDYQDDIVSSSASSGVVQQLIHYPISPLSLPNYPLVVFEDPVQRRYDLVHCSKLRRGDGNDVTPNLMRLRSMGEELVHLNRHISAQGELISAGAMKIFDHSDINIDLKLIQDISGCISNTKVIEQAKREKNKLASKICRLKKKAFHEANKIKYLGLEIEYNELATVIVKLKEMITNSLRESLTPENTHYESLSQHLGNTEDEINKHKDKLSSLLSPEDVNMFGGKKTIKVYSNIPGSLFKEALEFYENTHITKTAGRMDMLVGEVLQNYSSSYSPGSGANGYIESSNNTYTSNKVYNTPLLQALTNSNVYYTNHDEEKSPDTRSSSTAFHESPEINKPNTFQKHIHQSTSTSRTNYPGPPPEFKLIYE